MDICLVPCEPRPAPHRTLAGWTQGSAAEASSFLTISRVNIKHPRRTRAHPLYLLYLLYLLFTISTISTIYPAPHCHGMGKEAELYNDYRCLSHPWPLYTCEQRSRRRYTISAIWKLIGRNSGPRYLTPCACNVTQRTHEAKLRTRRSKIYKVFSLLASLITLMFSKFLNNTKHQYVIIFKIILFIKIFI